MFCKDTYRAYLKDDSSNLRYFGPTIVVFLLTYSEPKVVIFLIVNFRTQGFEN